jgi:integrase
MPTLTDVEIRAAIKRCKANNKMQRLAAGHWLTLLVTPQGIGRWQQRYLYGGKERTVSFGSYPRVTLAEASSKSEHARRLLREGLDPIEERRKQKAELRRVVENTFGAGVEAWYAFKSRTWKKATAEKVRQYLDKDILPSLRLRPMASVTTQDLVQTIARIEAREAHNVAAKARQWCDSIFNYAIASGWVKENPAEHLGEVSLPLPTAKNYAHLEQDELPELLTALKSYSGSKLVVGAIWLALWTANRPGITRTLKWSELDLDDALWTIKKGREGMKLGYAHLTPLPRQAVALLRDLHAISGTFEYVFIGRNDPRKPMSDAAVNKALATMGFKGRQTAHGFRHFVSTALNERGYEPDWVERQLSHGDPDKIRGTYNKAVYLEPRRKMMQEWADVIDRIANGSLRS